jgi:O-antigen/teichoic acid export membrane protein
MSHLIMGILNASLGWFLGSLYGARGVAYAYAIALAAASITLIAVYQHRNKVAWRKEFSKDHSGLLVACAAVMIFGWIAPLQISASGPLAITTGLILPPLVLGLTVWYHPLRQRLFGWLIARGARA